MRTLVPATLLALSFAAPALAAPDQTFELPSGSTLERMQTTSAPAPARRTPSLRNPWLAAGLTLGSPVLVAGLSYGANAGGADGNAYSAMTTVAGAGPLSLATGHLYAGSLGRGGAVVLGGYVIEAMGAVVGGPTVALMSGKEGEGAGFAFLSGLFIGPMVALGVYTLWAAFDAYQTAQQHNERELRAAEAPVTP